MVIGAIGQQKLTHFLSHVGDLKLEQGRVVVDGETRMTSVPGLFAGG